MARMRGAKWMNEASYLTDDDRFKIMQKVEECRTYCEHALVPLNTVGVRCPTYIGEPHPIAIVEYGPGRAIWASVYR